VEKELKWLKTHPKDIYGKEEENQETQEEEDK